jgi:putative flippase GtrA
VIPLQMFSVALRGLFRRHRRRLLKALVVSLPMTALGNGLFFLLVACCKTQPVLTNVLLLPITAVIGFVVNRPYVWGDRQIDRGHGLRRWLYKEGGFHLFSQGSFAILVGLMGASAFAVKLGTIALLALPTYALANGWIFAETEEERETA